MTSKRLTPLQAIKRYCRYECCANDLQSYRECSNTKCPLHAHKSGKRGKSLPKAFYFKKRAVVKVKTARESVSQEVTA